MKKILVLLFFIFSMTGCYDYKELNNLAIVSGIALDYDNTENKYKLTFEILNDDKVAENLEASKKTYYVNGEGKSITEAFNNTSLEIPKIPYYSHIKSLIISEDIAENHAKDFIDYLLRYSYINNMFYLFVAKDYDASQILKSTTTQNRIISESLYNLMDNTALGNSLAINVNFEDYVELFVNPMQDIYLPSVTLENKKLKLQGVAIFEDNNLKEILDSNETQTLNILFNKNKNAYYEFKCNDNEDKYVSINIYSQKVDYKINQNKYAVTANLMAKIEENQCNYNLKDKDTYKKLQKKFNKEINYDIEKLLLKLKENNSDVLGINYKYFRNNNKKLDFSKLDYKVNTNVNVNKNGLTFEVKDDNK